MILKYLGRKDWFLILILAVIVVAQVFLDLRIPEYMNDITNSIQRGAPIDVIADGGIGMLVCASLSLACAVASGIIAAKVTASLAMNLRKAQFERVQSFSRQDLDSFSIPSLVTRSTNDVYQLQQFIARAIVIAIKAPIMSVWATSKIAGGSMEWTAVTVVAVIAIAVIMTAILKFSIPFFKKVQWLTDGVNHRTRENVEGVRVIRAYNAEEMQTSRLKDACDEVLANNIKAEAIMAPLHPVVASMLNFLTLAIYWLGAGIINSAPDMDEQMYLFSDMIVYSSYAGQVLVSVMMLSGIFRGLPGMMVSARRIEDVIRHVPSMEDGDSTDIPCGGSVEFRDVSFSYPGSDAEILSHVSFTVGPGQTVAVVGSTGSGKSTLANLIPRLYDATSGSVLVDGVDVRMFPQAELRSRIGYVPQSSVIFTGTVRDNVAYGRPDVSDEEVRRALSVAQADFVYGMPEGISSEISKHGRNISGGQKQRIAIARAVCKDPEIYVFDDSFSALDFKTDRDLRRALRENTGGSTRIIVSQRIGTVMDADRIIVLEKGAVIGSGTHSELMRSCPEYRDMAESQMEGDARWCIRDPYGPGPASPRTSGPR